MDYTWVMIDSWHAVGENGFTICGLDYTEQDTPELVTSLPRDGKSCENCLRIIARSVDIEGAAI